MWPPITIISGDPYRRRAMLGNSIQGNQQPLHRFVRYACRSAAPPSISRYLLVQAALGSALGACFPFLLWATDTGSFGSLLLSGADGVTVVIFVVSSMMTFCPLAAATAIGLLSSRDR